MINRRSAATTVVTTTAATQRKSNGVCDVPGMGGGSNKKSTTEWGILWWPHSHRGDNDSCLEPPSDDVIGGADIAWCDEAAVIRLCAIDWRGRGEGRRGEEAGEATWWGEWNKVSVLRLIMSMRDVGMSMVYPTGSDVHIFWKSVARGILFC